MAASNAAKDRVSKGRQLSTAELLYQCAEQMGLAPSWVTNNGVFAITTDGVEQYINSAHYPLNSHVSASLAKDKYLTRLILERNGLPNIPFARPRTQAEAEAFLRKHGKIIAKPVHGSGSRDIHIIMHSFELSELHITSYILEQYVVGKEMRYLVLQGEVIGVYQSEYGTSVEEARALECISQHQAGWSPILVNLSLQIAQTLSLPFAAVDYLIDDYGHAYILEVNSAPDLKWFHAPTSGPAVDVARLFLEAALEGDILPPRGFDAIQPRDMSMR